MSEDKKLAIIGANEFQQRLILKAKELGYETHVFAWKDGAVGANDADYFYPVNIREKDIILKICQDRNINGITSIASDLAVITVNYVAGQMGLTGNSMESAKVCTNKYLMRKRLEESGMKVPLYKRVARSDELNINQFHFPIIVKPTDRSGSRSITKLYHRDNLEEAIKRAVDVSFEKKAIVEEYLEGDEYSCECISYHGQHSMLAITKKYTTFSFTEM